VRADSVTSWTGVPYLTTDELRRVYSVDEFEPLARERMHPANYGYVSGWAGTGATTRANTDAFWRYVLRPRALVDVGTVDLRTTVLGREIALPVIFGPSGYQMLAHPDGELASARASVRVGTVFGLSTSSNYSIEEIAAIAPGGWYQLYWFSDEGVTRDMIERAAAAGYTAIAVTVDAPTDLWREGEARTPPDIPSWVLSVNVPDRPLMRASHVTWKQLDWLRSLSPMKILLKGIATGEDAKLAVEHGIDGLIVSNHGGRQLDHGLGTIDTLPEIAAAVNGKIPIVLDGGITRGTDVVKALALGATAVTIGKLQGWGLGAGGQAGLVKVLELLEEEITIDMALMGVTRVDQITPSYVCKAMPVALAHEMSAFCHIPGGVLR